MTRAFHVSDMQPDLPMQRAGTNWLEFHQRQTAPGILTAASDAIRSEWVGSWALRQFQSSQFTPDPDFALTAKIVKELGDGIPTDMLGAFSAAHSMEEARHIRNNLIESLESQKRLESWGWTGVGLRLGAAILDPVAIGLTLATEGAAGPLVYGTKLTRMQRMIRGGLLAAGTNVALEGYLVSQDPTRDGRDLLYAGAAGFILGGSTSAFFPRRTNDIDRSLRSLTRQIELDNARSAGLNLTEAGECYWWQELSPQVQRERLNGLISHLDLPEDELASLRSLDTHDAFVRLMDQGRIPRQSPPIPAPEAVIEPPRPVRDVRTVLKESEASRTQPMPALRLNGSDVGAVARAFNEQVVAAGPIRTPLGKTVTLKMGHFFKLVSKGAAKLKGRIRATCINNRHIRSF